MKRILSLILASLLLTLPCAAMAQGAGGALMDLIGTPPAAQEEGADAPLAEAEPTALPEEAQSEDLPAEGWMRYTLDNADISIDLPEAWLGLTYELGTQSPMAELYDMPEDIVRETLSSMGAELYAITGLFKNHQVCVFTMPGSPVDMRKSTKWVDMDAYTESFRQAMPGCKIIESDLRQMGESNYMRVYFTMIIDGVKFAGLEYDTIVNGVQYTVQYAAPYSTSIDAENIAQMDAAVESIRFFR